LSKYKYQYFFNGTWINDYNAEIIIDILFTNFEKVFLRINTLDNYDTDNFLNNQKFIYSLNGMKTKFRKLSQKYVRNSTKLPINLLYSYIWLVRIIQYSLQLLIID